MKIHPSRINEEPTDWKEIAVFVIVWLILFLSALTAGAQVANVSVNSNTKVLVSPTAAQLAAANPLFVITSGSYADPAWITSLADSKVLPSQTSNSGKYLTTNGTVSSWVTLSTGLTIDSTAISGGTIGNILYHKTGNVVGEMTTSGSGTVVALTVSPNFTTPVLGTVTSGNFGSGTFTWPTFNQDTTGSAAKWTTARNLSLTGDGTATLSSVDGSAAVSAALTLATVNSNAGTFGDATHYGTVTVNAKGLITAASQTVWPTFNQNTSGTAAIATTVTLANEAADTTCFPLFGTAATGNLGAKSNAALTFNSATGTLGSTRFISSVAADGTAGVQIAATGSTIQLFATNQSIIVQDTIDAIQTLTFGDPTVTGTLTVPNATGTLLYSAGPLATPASGTLTNCTGLPLTTGITGTLSQANIAALTGDVTKPSGSGVTTLANIPAIAGTNLTGTGANFTAGDTLKINGATLGTTTATSGNLLIGSGSTWVSVAASGDVTISSSGVTTIGSAKVTNAMLASGVSAGGNSTDSGKLASYGTLGAFTASATVTVKGTGLGSGALQLYGANSTYYGLIGMPTLAGNVTITMPAATGTLSTLAGTETLTNKSIDAGQLTGSIADARNTVSNTTTTSLANLATVGTVTSGIWNAGALTSSGAISGTTLVGTSSLTLGVASTTAGTVVLKNATSTGTTTIAGANASSTSYTWTVPAATDTAVGKATTDTLTNKTLTTPTIADLTNATHSHQNAAGGGSLDAAAIGSGNLADARNTVTNSTTTSFTALNAATTTNLVKPIARQTFSNANASITAGNNVIAQTGTMSANRTLTLPLANAVTAGDRIFVVDESGTVGSNVIFFARAGSDTINGNTSATTFYIENPYGTAILESDGSSKWTLTTHVNAAAASTSKFINNISAGGSITATSNVIGQNAIVIGINTDTYFTRSGTAAAALTGSLSISGTSTLGTGTAIKNIRHGVSGAMVLGTVTVTDTGCTANTRYFFSAHTLGTISVPGGYYASTRTASTSFVITSSQPTETSTIDWMAVEP